MSNILKFPENFLWGSAVASYQVEGGIENCDWSHDFPAGRACDYYNRYEQYFDMAHDLGQNIHRLSIEWSRIEPEEGKFNKEAIEHYKKILLALKARGMKSMVTIWHWTNPIWFAQKGGWNNSASSDYFVRYVKFIVPQLDNLVDFWATLNEPTIYQFLAFLEGRFPPYKHNPVTALKVYLNLAAAHNKAYREIHKINNNAKAGIVYNFSFTSSTNDSSFLNKIFVKAWNLIANRIFLIFIKGSFDFLGVNYYFHDTIKTTWRKFPFVTVSHDIGRNVNELGWEIFPEGIYHVLKDLKKYNLPIYITENGIADAKDKKRERFIKDHLKWVHKAISEGADVRGYLHWSLVDNFEWTYGFKPKFGLIEIDEGTLKTKIRPSAYEYAKICKNNSLTI